MITSPARNARHRRWIYRLAIPVAALCAFAIIALLWASGLQSVGFTVLRVLGVEPGQIPFLDTHAILSAAECQRRGVDVYLSNPCDVLGRSHAYSPLWLALVPPGLGTASAPWVGAALDLLVIVALPVLIRGCGKGEIVVMAIAVFSPMTVYALERGNNDLVIFLLVLCAGLLQAAARRWRLCSYVLLVGAALLKYYPAVLLVLLARDRRRDAVLVATGAAGALALFAAGYHDALGRALSNIPVAASYFTDSFSAQNLPFGLTQGLRGLPTAAPIAILLFGTLSAFALARAWRTAVLLNTLGIDWTTSAMRFAAIGGLLVTGCFFAGQNVDYRGVFFLFVLPGLVQLRGATDSTAARKFLSRLIAAVLFVMWGEFFRRALQAGLGALLGPALGNHFAMLFWILRELVWWWLIAGLAAIAICHLTQPPPNTSAASRWLRYPPRYAG